MALTDISNYIEIQNISASVDQGGWECRFRAKQDTDICDINQEILIDWRGGFDGPPGPERLGFKGYVMPTRITVNLTGSEAEFIAKTTHGYLQEMWLQGISFAEVDARNHYHEFSDTAAECPAEDMGYELNLGKIVKHILGYYDTCADIGPEWVAHTNLVKDMVHNPNGWISLDGVETSTWGPANTGGSMATSIYIVRETSNLWSRLQEIARNEFFTIQFDKLDNLYYRRHPMFEAVLPDPVMTFDQSFGLAPFVAIPLADKQKKQVRLHAVTDDEDTLHSDYPASPTFVYGDKDERSNIRCNSQDTLDYWAERLYLFDNRDYTVKWTAAGAVGLLFELLDRVEITYAGTTYNGLDISWSQKKFWIHEIEVVPHPGFGAVTTFTLEAESS